MPLLVGAESVDHPGAHVVDRDEGGDGGTPGRKRLENQRRVEARQRGAADVFAHIDGRHAERRRLANHVDGKVFLLVPFERMRRQPVVGEGARHVPDRDVVRIERESVHSRPSCSWPRRSS